MKQEKCSTEQWRKIPGFDNYEVSNLGRLKSWLPPRNFGKVPSEGSILNPTADKDGYYKTTLRQNGKRKTVRICILVCMAWHGERPFCTAVVRHLDGSKSNDTPDNLRWGTTKENYEDSVLHGTNFRGTRVNTCKLTEQDVRDIRSSDLSCTELAMIYPVNSSMISKIRKRRNWAHVT